MCYGITESTWIDLKYIFKKYDFINRVILYGSRAKGNYKPGSDIDLAIMGDDISLKDMQKLLLEVDELYLPYEVDLCIYDKITNPEFKAHIDRVGVAVYTRNQ